MREKPALLVEIGVLFTEAVNTTGRIKEALLAGEEGMAGRTDFHMHNFTLGRNGFYLIAAGADDFSLVRFGMDLFFHDRSSYKVGTRFCMPTRLVWQVPGVTASLYGVQASSGCEPFANAPPLEQ